MSAEGLLRGASSRLFVLFRAVVFLWRRHGPGFGLRVGSRRRWRCDLPLGRWRRQLNGRSGRRRRWPRFGRRRSRPFHGPYFLAGRRLRCWLTGGPTRSLVVRHGCRRLWGWLGFGLYGWPDRGPVVERRWCRPQWRLWRRNRPVAGLTSCLGGRRVEVARAVGVKGCTPGRLFGTGAGAGVGCGAGCPGFVGERVRAGAGTAPAAMPGRLSGVGAGCGCCAGADTGVATAVGVVLVPWPEEPAFWLRGAQPLSCGREEALARVRLSRVVPRAGSWVLRAPACLAH